MIDQMKDVAGDWNKQKTIATNMMLRENKQNARANQKPIEANLKPIEQKDMRDCQSEANLKPLKQTQIVAGKQIKCESQSEADRAEGHARDWDKQKTIATNMQNT